MLLKDAPNSSKSFWSIPKLRFRKLIKWTLILGGLALFGLACIAYGTRLHKQGIGFQFREWANSVSNNKFQFALNYFDGMSANPESVKLDVKFDDFEKLAYQRYLAMELGNKYRTHPWNMGMVPAKLHSGDKSMSVKMRLKGGQEDHFGHYKKWSFKLKVKGDHKLMGMKNFSLQHPRTRTYINGWLFNQLLGYNNLINLRYDFVNLELNGEDYGLYALEENMGKELIEHNERKEAPIVNFDTELIWASSAGHASNYWKASPINVYDDKAVVEDPGQAKYYGLAKNMLEGFREAELRPSQIFDLEKYATLFAITDLMGYHHGLFLYNHKFYYNPITSLLEPIGYDNQEIMPIQIDPNLGANRRLAGQYRDQFPWGPQGIIRASDLSSEDRVPESYETYAKRTKADNSWLDLIFLEPEFYRLYVQKLLEFSKPESLQNFFVEIEEEMAVQEKKLHQGFPHIVFGGRKILEDNQKVLQKLLNPEVSMHAYLKEAIPGENKIKIQLINQMGFPQEVLSVKLGEKELAPEPLILPAGKADLPFVSESIEFQLPEGLNWQDSLAGELELSFHLLGTDSVQNCDLIPWSKRDTNFVKNDFVRANWDLSQFPFISLDPAGVARIKPGKWILDQPLKLPAGYRLEIAAGTEIDLQNNALIYCQGPLNMTGTVDAPIRIYSSDTSGQGIVVMNATEESRLSWVNFEDLRNPNQGSWTLTGAVTFHESDVKLSNCTFARNYCEDALNIVRSHYTLDSCGFSEVFSDAFDGDFTIGQVLNCSFDQIGNDAVDVSGSMIEVFNLQANLIGDKALSAGEKSQMKVEKALIRNSEIGLTSKDHSSLVASDISLENCKLGFAAFVKKQEFGAASIDAENVILQAVEVPYLIEEGSKMMNDGEEIPVATDKVKDLLYGIKFGKASKR